MVRRRYRNSGDVPRRGDKVFDQSRELPAEQPNGTVVQVYYEERRVYVDFGKVDNRRQTKFYDFDDFSGRWTDQFEGSWMLL